MLGLSPGIKISIASKSGHNTFANIEDKYAAVLQAHLTGKALKVFTELSVAECQHYPILKAALLAAYSVVQILTYMP